jgi:1,4-alpha-glucan branching enzyme
MKYRLIRAISKKYYIMSESPGKRRNSRIKKQYLKSRPVCRVTFRLPKDAAPEAQRVNISGDFNDWDQELTVMTRLRNGDFTITLELEKGREYHFRYLIDGKRWANDWFADKYLPNPFGGDDSVVLV